MPQTVMGISHRDWVAILGASALMTIAYPPFHLLVPGLVCLVPVLLRFWAPGPPLRHAARGFWFGVVSNAVLLHWMAVAVWRFKPSAVWAFLLVVLAFGLYTGAMFGLVAWIRARTRLPLILVFPAAWTALEWLGAHHGAIAISWLGLGTSLTTFTPLIQLADTVGARGLTFLLCAANVALALAWRQRQSPRIAVALAGGVMAGLILLLAYGWMRLTSLQLRAAGEITVVQPNLGAEHKWDPQLQDSLVELTLALSQKAARDRSPDLVVWPELALPAPLLYRQGWISELELHSRDVSAPVLAGGIDLVPQSEGAARTYNAALLFGSRTRPRPTPYRKERLVLLFERFNGTSAGTDNVLMETTVGRVGVLICHEATFERLARARRRAGADVLVNLANDAWFIGTAAPSQHAAHIVMRAIETRSGIVRAGNSGPSGFVDALGRSYDWTAQDTRTSTTAVLYTSDVVPLYVRIGDWVGALSVAIVLTLAVVSAARGTHPRSVSHYCDSLFARTRVTTTDVQDRERRLAGANRATMRRRGRGTRPAGLSGGSEEGRGVR